MCLLNIVVFTQTFNTERRLQLKFHPENIYAKSAFGDRSSTTGILLKVKIRRRRVPRPEDDVSPPTVTVLGLTEYIYRFDSKLLLHYFAH